VPLYEYKCLKCGRHTEKIEFVSGPHLKKCPHCAGKVEALISAPSIQFKGSGWYVTDYARKSSAGDSGKDEKSASEKKDDASKDSSKDSAKNSGNDSGKDSASKETPAKETKDTKERKSEKTSSKK
jgi:putative FmdB family regulatory protein